MWPEASTPSGLSKELAEIRNTGLATQISREHIVGFAVPIYKQDQVVASLGVFLPVSRLTNAHRKNIIDSLRKAAVAIGQLLAKK